jgi:alpha-amylase
VGKNWTCARAMEMVDSEWVLFVDADVRLAPRLSCGCLAEWMVQPIMATLMGIGFPIEATNDAADATAFAAGPFMLFRRSAYAAIGGHAALAAEVVEDLALARRIKAAGFRLRYLLGLDAVELRIYADFAALWEGWSKNWFTGLDRHVPRALGAAATVGLMFSGPWLLALRLWTGHHFALSPRHWWLMGAAALLLPACAAPTPPAATLPAAPRQPTAILHAHDEPFAQVRGYVCSLARQGYSHVQIAPAQLSNGDGRPGSGRGGGEWWRRYQPVDHLTIAGRGSRADLRALTRTARGCGMKVIADVVFNHMASDPAHAAVLRYPGLGPDDFHRRCAIDYSDGDTLSERRCWLNGDLPDLDHSRPSVMALHERHLRLLLEDGVDGFRFDAAKHIEPATLRTYLEVIRRHSGGRAWSYLEVIDDGDTSAAMYAPVAPVTDFVLCDSLQQVFGPVGWLSGLRLPRAIDDGRSITFAVNHDSDPSINPGFPRCRVADRGDAHLASAYVLAREAGTPLILARDNLQVAYLSGGARFRSLMRRRGEGGANVRETVLAVADPRSVLVMERGGEGLFVVNKAAETYDIASLDLSLSQLEGCYLELRNDFTIAIERRGDGRKFLTRWGGWQRGGMRLAGRDALFFARVPFDACR